MPIYDASPEWLKERGLRARDARRLFNALSTLIDYEGTVSDALTATRHQSSAMHEVCDALRYLVDGEAC